MMSINIAHASSYKLCDIDAQDIAPMEKEMKRLKKERKYSEVYLLMEEYKRFFRKCMGWKI